MNEEVKKKKKKKIWKESRDRQESLARWSRFEGSSLLRNDSEDRLVCTGVNDLGLCLLFTGFP